MVSLLRYEFFLQLLSKEICLFLCLLFFVS
jgi:hypothetical protein